jgi:beta-lactamase superfamily II metal-dependent hydrolase
MIPVRSDEFEISLFGPGYGECAVIHLGANQWVIVDSCRDQTKRSVVPLDYLARIGVDPSVSVRLVLATHWHDDHVRGLGEVVDACTRARFVCASALTKNEFVTMVMRYEDGSARTPSGSGVREMYRVLRRLAENSRQVNFAAPNRLILRCEEVRGVSGRACEITTLSPSDKQLEIFWSEIADQMPELRHTMRRAVAKSPNHLATALWITAGEEAVLLGSDLEETADPATGWSVIVQSDERPLGIATVFKIPHHGSENGHSDDVWDRMVAKGAFALLSPFTNGNVRLPTNNDINRIVARAGYAYLTSNPHLRPPVKRPATVARAIRTRPRRLMLAEPKVGHIRLRKRYGGDHRWYVALMGGARKLTGGLAAA